MLRGGVISKHYKRLWYFSEAVVIMGVKVGSLIKVGSSVDISVKWGSYCRGKSEQMFLILSGIAQHVLHLWKYFSKIIIYEIYDTVVVKHKLSYIFLIESILSHKYFALLLKYPKYNNIQ